MKKFFITSSGTGIGKTFVTTALCKELLEKGKSVHALKPVISGWSESEDNDIFQILDSLDLLHTKENIEKISLYRFVAPLSPDMAAAEEEKSIDFQKIIDFCNSSDGADYLLIEGVGGVMVPLTDNHTILDLMDRLKMPTILIVGSYLGSISHTLTAINVMQSRDIDICAVIVSESPESTVSIDKTVTTLKNFIKEPILSLPIVDLQKNEYNRNIQDIITLLDNYE